MTYSTDKVTRVEIIDENGRSYTNFDPNNKVELSFQDNERTLKVFISRVNPDEREPHSLITKTLKDYFDDYDELENQKMSSYRATKIWEAFKGELIDNGLKDSEDVRQGLSSALRKVADRLCTDVGEMEFFIEVVRQIADELEAL